MGKLTISIISMAIFKLPEGRSPQALQFCRFPGICLSWWLVFAHACSSFGTRTTSLEHDIQKLSFQWSEVFSNEVLSRKWYPKWYPVVKVAKLLVDDTASAHPMQEPETGWYLRYWHLHRWSSKNTNKRDGYDDYMIMIMSVMINDD